MSTPTAQPPVPGQSRRRPGPSRLEQPSAQYVQRVSDIVEAAARAFQERGYSAASLDSIADSLDLRKSTLYHYVSSKPELLRMVFEHTLTLALDVFAEMRAIEDPRSRLRALIDLQIRTVVAQPTYFAVFFEEKEHLEPGAAATIHKMELQYLAVFEAAVHDATEAGVLPEMDPRLAAQAIIGMTNWTYKWFRKDRDDPEAFVDTCLRLLVGMGQESGDHQVVTA